MCVCVYSFLFILLYSCFLSTVRQIKRETQLCLVGSGYVFIIFWKLCQILQQRHLCVSLLLVLTDHCSREITLESQVNRQHLD